MAELIWHICWVGVQGPLIISDFKKKVYVDEAQLTVTGKKKKTKRKNKNGAHLKSIKDFTTLSESSAVKFRYL